MSKIIALKIDVSKIDKARLFKGQKGTYLDAVLFLNDEPGQYGDHGMITQSVSKEERESGVQGAILGNARILSSKSPTSESSEAVKAAESLSEESDDLPF